MTQSILLIGCGGHARSLIDIIESSNYWKIYGFVGLTSELDKYICGYPVIGTDSDLPRLRKKCSHAFLALGQIGNATNRQELARHLNELGFNIPTLVSKYAAVSRHARLGIGTCVGHGAIVNSCSSVGDFCILNSNSLVEHDSTIGDFCHISTGVLVNGGVSIGSCSFVGSGAIIREQLALPSGSIISAGKRVMGWPLKND